MRQERLGQRAGRLPQPRNGLMRDHKCDGPHDQHLRDVLHELDQRIHRKQPLEPLDGRYLGQFRHDPVTRDNGFALDQHPEHGRQHHHDDHRGKRAGNAARQFPRHHPDIGKTLRPFANVDPPRHLEQTAQHTRQVGQDPWQQKDRDHQKREDGHQVSRLARGRHIAFLARLGQLALAWLLGLAALVLVCAHATRLRSSWCQAMRRSGPEIRQGSRAQPRSERKARPPPAQASLRKRRAGRASSCWPDPSQGSAQAP